MFGIGAGELLIIMALALIVVGPAKLPEIGRSIGGALNQFKSQTDELKSALSFDSPTQPPKSSPVSHFPGFGAANGQGYAEAVQRMNTQKGTVVQEDVAATPVAMNEETEAAAQNS